MAITQAKRYRSFIEINRSHIPSFLTRKFIYAQLLCIYQHGSEARRPFILEAIEEIQREHIDEYIVLNRDPEQRDFITKCRQRNEIPLMPCDTSKGIQHDVFPLVRDNLRMLPYLDSLRSADNEAIRLSYISIYVALACAPSNCIVDRYGTLNFASLYIYMMCGPEDPMQWGRDPIIDSVYNQINSVGVAASLLKRIADIPEVVFTMDMPQIRGWLVERIWDYDTMDKYREIRNVTIRLYNTMFGNFNVSSLDNLPEESYIRTIFLNEDINRVLIRCKRIFTQRPRELNENSLFMKFTLRVFEQSTDVNLIRDTINFLGARILRSRTFWSQLILTFKEPGPFTETLLKAYDRKFPCVDVALIEELRESLCKSSRLRVENLMTSLDVV